MKERWTVYLQWVLKIYGVVFGVLGAVSIFFPMESVTKNNISRRIWILVGICLFLFIIAFICARKTITKKSRTLYSSGKTKIIFEYKDFKSILSSDNDTQERFTVVVPVNTSMNLIGNRDYIKKNSIHHLCLNYLFEKRNKELSKDVFKNAVAKKGKANLDLSNPLGKIGDWYFITSKELGIDSKIRFLFIEVNDIENKNGVNVIKSLSKEQYFKGLQSLIEAIPDVMDQEEKIYIPLIGAGNGNVGKSYDIMNVMAEMLRFNKSILRQEIHVFINEKYAKETPIHMLTDFKHKG